MKIVRVVFKVDYSTIEYYFDRVYDPEKTDQQNCDDVINVCVETLKNKEPLVAVKYVADKKVKPVIINSAVLKEMLLERVSVYTADDAEKQKE
jgi:hypothetical protein